MIGYLLEQVFGGRRTARLAALALTGVGAVDGYLVYGRLEASGALDEIRAATEPR